MAEFIAEISSNHNGDPARCRELIRAAAACGCHGVKFQLFRIEKLFAPEILRVSPEHRRRRRWELPPWFLPELAACARDHGLRFGCTPFDLEAVDALLPWVDFLKVASYELPWPALLRKCAGTGLPVILSTGMADGAEIEAAVRACSACADLTVLHCVSSYPAPARACNLAAIGALRALAERALGRPVRCGWSDHSVDGGVIRRAVQTWNADVVEFHFDLEGRGEEFGGGHCWLPAAIGPVIARRVPPAGGECDGDGRLGPTPQELQERRWRADPSDGLRPTLAVREEWPQQQPGFAPGAARILVIPAGVGLGHLMRCIALAETLRDELRIESLFLIPDADVHRGLLARHGFAWLPLPADQPPLGETWLQAVKVRLSALLPAGIDACVVDLQPPAGALVRLLKDQGLKVAALDQPQVQGADLRIVPSLTWRPDSPRADLVGGREFLLIRRDAADLRPAAPPAVRRGPVVVTFGGEDPHRLTERAAAAAVEVAPRAPVQVVVGPNFADGPRRAAELARRHPDLEVLTGVAGLERLLAPAGLVITALGVTVGEAMCLGAPVAILTNWPVDRAEAGALHAAGLVHDLGHHEDVGPARLTAALRELWGDPDRRLALARAGWEGCDGQGAARAAVLIAALCGVGGEDGRRPPTC